MHKTYINYKILQRRGACSRQVDLFRKTFGDEDVPITVENIEKASKEGLSIDWLMYRVAPYSLWFDRAYKAYMRSGTLGYVEFMQNAAKKALIKELKATNRL